MFSHLILLWYKNNYTHTSPWSSIIDLAFFLIVLILYTLKRYFYPPYVHALSSDDCRHSALSPLLMIAILAALRSLWPIAFLAPMYPHSTIVVYALLHPSMTFFISSLWPCSLVRQLSFPTPNYFHSKQKQNHHAK